MSVENNLPVSLNINSIARDTSNTSSFNFETIDLNSINMPESEIDNINNKITGTIKFGEEADEYATLSSLDKLGNDDEYNKYQEQKKDPRLISAMTTDQYLLEEMAKRQFKQAQIDLNYYLPSSKLGGEGRLNNRVDEDYSRYDNSKRIQGDDSLINSDNIPRYQELVNNATNIFPRQVQTPERWIQNENERNQIRRNVESALPRQPAISPDDYARTEAAFVNSQRKIKNKDSNRDYNLGLGVNPNTASHDIGRAHVNTNVPGVNFSHLVVGNWSKGDCVDQMNKLWLKMKPEAHSISYGDKQKLQLLVQDIINYFK